MSSLEELENLRRTQIIKYQALLEQGALTAEEYRELVQDQLDLSEITKNLETEAMKIQAQRVYQVLRDLSGLL